MKDFKILESEVIFGHRVCQTTEAKWLCIDNIYQKFHRPNFYDIGGTYVDDVADYWFLFKTETVGEIHLLHLFLSNRPESSFTLSLSCNSDLSFQKKHNKAFLPSTLKTIKFDFLKEKSHNYVTTYSFTSLEVDLLNNKKLYIQLSFGNESADENTTDITKKDYDFKSLLTDPIGSDFVIESADGTKFAVHKVLLGANSEVFKAMLKENTAESQNSYMKMIDVNKEDLQKILEFIYSGTIEDIEGTNFFNLLMLSDRYDLIGLRELSEHILASQLNTENVIETLAVADLHNSDDLKLAAFKFIKVNKNAIHGDMFEELNNVELVRELCQFLVPCF